MQMRLWAMAMAAGVMGLGMAPAAEPQKGPNPVEVKVEAGTRSNALRFVPDDLERGVFHGSIHDIEVLPGATVAWYFYPMTNGEDLPLYCHKEGHRESGMVGAMTISGPPPFQAPSK